MNKSLKGGLRPLYLVKVLQAYSDRAIGQVLIVSKKEYKKYKDHLKLLKEIGREDELSIIK